MKRTFSPAFIMGNRGCYSETMVKQMFTDNRVAKKSVTIKDFINFTISYKDRCWFLCNKAFSKAENKAIALLALEKFKKYFTTTYKETKEVTQYFSTITLYLNDKVKWQVVYDDFWKAYYSLNSARGGWVLHNFRYNRVCASPGVVFENVSYRFLTYSHGIKELESDIEQIVSDFIK